MLFYVILFFGYLKFNMYVNYMLIIGYYLMRKYNCLIIFIYWLLIIFVFDFVIYRMVIVGVVCLSDD